MSAIDVSHAIAQADLALGTAGLRPDNILRRELRASGAAVAELIEAAEGVWNTPRPAGSDPNGRYSKAEKRLAAALANIGAAT